MIDETAYGITKRAKVTTLTSSINCFGDSFSDSGGGWAFPTWIQLLATELQKTLIGRGGIAGAKTFEILANQIYNDYATRAFASTDSCFLFMGINDLNAYYVDDNTRDYSPDVVTDGIVANTTTAMLYCALPGSCKYNARNSTKTGTWVNTPSYTNLGVGTITPGSSISQVVTGRYVSFTITNVGELTFTADYGPSFNWSVTNTLLGDNTIGTYIAGGAAGTAVPYRVTCKLGSGQFCIRTFIFDTGVEGDHTITITLDSNESGPIPLTTNDLWVDWFGGWSDSVRGNDVIVLGIPSWDYARAFDTSSANLCSDTHRLDYNRRLKEAAESLYHDFSLPVRYVDLGYMPNAHLQFDGFHPNAIGFRHIKNKVIKSLRGAIFAE